MNQKYLLFLNITESLFIFLKEEFMSKKCLKKMITTSAILITGMHAFNTYIQSCITPVSISKEDQIYKWKDMQIIHTNKGTPSAPPLLLLHNLDPSSSKEEWYQADPLLEQNFHIFELDLPGCGKSDKPNMTYINYLYVQLICDFIRDIVKEKCNICASAFSNAFVFMATRMKPDMFDQIIAINPPSIQELVKPISKQSEWKKKIIESPVIGTFLYNCRMSKSSIWDDYKYVYFYNDKNVPEKIAEVSYFNAHYKNDGGKYLYGSMIGNYTNINIVHALPLIKANLSIIAYGKYKEVIQEYKKYNSNIHAVYISNCRLLPQLEISETIADKIKSILLKNT